MIGAVIMQWKQLFWDLWSASRHTEDFSHNRARILNRRTRLIAIVMAVLTLLWIPVDYIALEQVQFQQVLWVRLCWVGGLLLSVFGFKNDGRSIRRAYLRLWLIVILFSASYLYLWGSVFDAAEQSEFSAGYSFLPYIAITMLSVFPLTILEAAFAIVTVTLFVLGADLQSASILDLTIWIKLWFIGVISGIILWASASQLHGLMVLYREATRDAVTGLINRRLILDELERIREKVLKRGVGGGVLLADLDRFKRVNDEYGHLNGDRVLRDFAAAVVSVHPALTVAGRFGGEEFLMLVEGVDRQGMMEVAEALNQVIRERVVKGLDGEVLRYSTSIGVAEFVADEPQESLLERVDSALYEAKGAGRDCAVLAPLPAA